VNVYGFSAIEIIRYHGNVLTKEGICNARNLMEMLNITNAVE
jgi:hypothetical protein